MRKFIYPILALICVAALVWIQTEQDKALNEIPAPEVNASDQTEQPKPWTTTLDFLPKSDHPVVHHHTYSLGYSEKHEQAQWTAHVLRYRDMNSKDYKRPYFEIDDKVSTGAAHWRNYKDSGYDRGHLVPAGDRKATQQAFEETFLTSNISPQKHDFNAGIWNKLEQQVRKYAREQGDLYVVTGPVLKEGLKTIGSEQVSVPEAFYKIIYWSDADKSKMAAWLIPTSASSYQPNDFLTSVDRIETLTGVDFFSQLEDALEDQLEKGVQNSI